MKYKTFQNKTVDTDDLGHQHLSNIYWFNKILNGYDVTKLDYINNRITTEFNGIILPYKPHPYFKMEIDELDKRGFLLWKEVDGLRIADIIYQGKTVGSAYYIEDHRESIIDQIVKD